MRDPAQKMSKSAADPNSRITIADSAENIMAKIKAAVTDSVPGISYEPETRPGVANLLTIWSAIDEEARRPELLAQSAADWGMSRLKQEIGQAIIETQRPITQEFHRYMSDLSHLKMVARKGRMVAERVAEETMVQVRQLVGLDRL